MSLSLDVLHRLRPSFRPTLPFGAACWLSLSPDRVVLQQPQAEQPQLAVPGSGSKWDMEGALLAWEALWQDSALQRQQLRVILPDQWTRGVALTLPNGIQSEEDIRRFALAEFRQRFGDGMDHWHLDWTTLNHSVLAIACPHSLIQRLQISLVNSHSRLIFLNTQSLETLRVVYPELPNDRWCVLVSKHNLTLVRIQHGEFRGYWNHPLDEQLDQDLLMLLERHHRLLGEDRGLVEIIDPHRLVPTAVWKSTLQTTGWKVETLSLPISPTWSGPVSTWHQFVGREFS
jgi:hypothetical protein